MTLNISKKILYLWISLFIYFNPNQSSIFLCFSQPITLPFTIPLLSICPLALSSEKQRLPIDISLFSTNGNIEHVSTFRKQNILRTKISYQGKFPRECCMFCYWSRTASQQSALCLNCGHKWKMVVKTAVNSIYNRIYGDIFLCGIQKESIYIDNIFHFTFINFGIFTYSLTFFSFL